MRSAVRPPAAALVRTRTAPPPALRDCAQGLIGCVEPGSHLRARPARASFWACKRVMLIGSLPSSPKFSEDGVWLHVTTEYPIVFTGNEMHLSGRRRTFRTWLRGNDDFERI